jgi:3D (Asp-Asp-Asp) domain-containing protein
MKKLLKQLLAIIFISAFFFSPAIVFAEDPPSYEAASTIHLNISTPEQPQPKGFLNTIRSWLGVRGRLYLRPQPGTTYAVRATAYAPSPYQTDATPCITAAGTVVRQGTVASNFLPMGTLLLINGELFIVEDRMNPRYDKAIDIYFPSTSEARKFGNEILEITIAGYGEPGQALPREDKQQPAQLDKAVSKKVSPIRGQFIQLSRVFLGAKSYDVNRYDVDCFNE